MELTTVKELFSDREKYLDKEVQVGGWIRSIRDSKAFGFIVLNDGTCFATTNCRSRRHRNISNASGCLPRG